MVLNVNKEKTLNGLVDAAIMVDWDWVGVGLR